jgi:hypothetical protein
MAYDGHKEHAYKQLNIQTLAHKYHKQHRYSFNILLLSKLLSCP